MGNKNFFIEDAKTPLPGEVEGQKYVFFFIKVHFGLCYDYSNQISSRFGIKVYFFLIFLVVLYIPKSFKNAYSNIIFYVNVAKSLLYFDFVYAQISEQRVYDNFANFCFLSHRKRWFLRVKRNVSVIKQEAVIPEALSPFFKLSHGTKPLSNYNSMLKYSILLFICLFRLVSTLLIIFDLTKVNKVDLKACP
ncbi:hypothetical protein EGR_03943 [Echinococcus granulosus]|uniref:Uncharacterized protein n=1 Tax=Echinococcus granulosus TaxID=6210 RepID=W6UJP7_ECHGR|nr:hypothetical protein EGR_03943 [Echinococcus granulosus]EUB61268.1 hypothetical protein EGR_03943 [Echinococcus granulosus]